MAENSTTVRVFGPRYHEAIRLRDGNEVFLKSIRPEDKATLAAGFEQMSSESRFRRFFSAKSRLTPEELRYFTEVDGESHFALAAGRHRDDGSVEGLGTARFVRQAEEPAEAEFAVAVVDGWQGRGLGRALLTRLVTAAQERGIERLIGTVMAHNDAMIHLLSTSSQARLRWQGGFVEVVFDLQSGRNAPGPEEHAARMSIARAPQCGRRSVQRA